MAEQNYSMQDIQQALQQGLLTEDDASYLAEALGNQGSGMGAAIGAAAGGVGMGMAGGKLASMGAKRLGAAGTVANMDIGGLARNMSTVAPLAESGLPGMIANRSAASLGGAGAAGLMGAAGGAMGGSALMGEQGAGVGTENPVDQALRIIIDANAPKKLKEQAAMFLQQQQQAQGGEEGDTSTLLNMLAGAGGAAALGGAGYGLGRMGAKGIQSRSAAVADAPGEMEALDNALLSMSRERPIPMMAGRNYDPLSAGLGASAGLGGGVGGYQASDGLQERYGNPF